MMLTSQKKPLDLSPDAFGTLADSSALVSDGVAMRAALERDGYLFLPSALDSDLVGEARAECLRRLSDAEALEPGTDPLDAVARKDCGSYFSPQLAEGNAPLHQLLYGGAMMAIYERLLGGAVRPFDFTWLRAVSPGSGTAPHCDTVYMGRGTDELFTSWTPLGDIPRSIGGLIVLEKSHERTDVTGDYLKQDVDSYCIGGPGEEAVKSGKLHWEHWQKPGEPWDGTLSHDPPALLKTFGGRWLTADYKIGDVLIFTIRTVHASLDNGSDRIRLSADTRYQRASDPADERWIVAPDGGAPPGHDRSVKRGRVC